MSVELMVAASGGAFAEENADDYAVVSPELRDADRVIRCQSMDLLRGSLRRRGVPVRNHLRLEVGRGELKVFSTHVAGGAAPALFAGVAGSSADLRDAVRSVVDSWNTVSGPRRVLLAGPRSFCAGVERAIQIVERALAVREGPVYVRRQIVHNTAVIDELAGRGALFVNELDEVPSGATVVLSAHGVSPAVREQASRRGLDVIDGTCPLVAKVHAEARRFAARGDTIVLIGHADHEEVEGTLGEAPGSTVLVETAQDVEALTITDPQRVSYLIQTTLAVDETVDVIAALRARFPELNEPPDDDICYATANRQNALRAIAEDSDLVLVVGSENSSNSLRLVELAHRQGRIAYLIDDAADIRPEWLSGVRTVGLTAGASAPPALVEQVVTALDGLGPVMVEERSVTRETIHFELPAALRERRSDDGPTPTVHPSGR